MNQSITQTKRLYSFRNLVFYQQSNISTLRFKQILNDTTEYFENDQELKEKIKILTNLIKNSKYPILLTGAGVSTESGIPDYRSGINSVLETGPGKWEKEFHKIQLKEEQQKKIKKALNAEPNFSHMILAQMIQKNIFKKIITQNVDNLHHKSKVPKSKIIELHGNIQTEQCEKCSKIYYRGYYVRPVHLQQQLIHFHGNYCNQFKCDGRLLDTLIFFGETIQPSLSQKAIEIVNQSDFCLVIGSSLTVNSASKLIKQIKDRNQKYGIINLQKTQFSDLADISINDKISKVLELLAIQFNLNSQQKFEQEYNIILEFKKIQINSYYLNISCFDFEFQYISAIKYVHIDYISFQGQTQSTLLSEPFQIILDSLSNITKIHIEFHQNYDEIGFTFDSQLLQQSWQKDIFQIKSNLKYQIDEKSWKFLHTVVG